jgi:hypothetical protein
MSNRFLMFSFLTKKELEDIEKSIPFMKSKEEELTIKLNETLNVLLKAFGFSITANNESNDEENSVHKEFRSFINVVKNMNKEEYDEYNTKLLRNYLAKREKRRRTREETA